MISVKQQSAMLHVERHHRLVVFMRRSVALKWCKIFENTEFTCREAIGAVS